MTPNPSDIHTIHCSQGDTEAREWEFELHNNGEIIDASEIADQITFKAYKGGTEEILPNALMNGSVDLGSLDWSYTDGVFFSSESVGKTQTANAQPTIFCIPFVAKPVGYNGAYSGEDKVIWQHPNASLRVRDSAYTSPAEFKLAMQGVKLWYEKADSNPTTSPFDGTIKYPSGSVDSYFTYRESPTEEDGNAKITGIKGNTLNWNQLVQNGNFADGTNNWSGFSNTTTVSNNKATVKCINTTDQFSFYPSNINFIQNHKYLITFKITLYGNAKVSRNKLDNSGNTGRLASGVHAFIETAFSSSVLGGYRFLYAEPVSNTADDYYTLENCMLIDLTQMGLDITDPSEFTSLFSLPYYSYNQGSLLSFNGNGIKTVGKNMIDVIEQGAYTPTGSDATSTTRLRAKFVSVQPNTTYSVKISGTVTFDVIYTEFSKNDRQTQNIYQSSWAQDQATFTTLPDCYYVKLLFKDHNNANATLTPDMVTEVQLEKSSAPTSYEPYTSSTLSLPISTYFPNGMDGVGTAYDELTNTKATTRMARVDLGTLDYVYDSTVPRFYTSGLNSIIKKPSTSDDMGEILCGSYQTLTVNQFFAQARNMTTMLTITGNVSFINTNYTSATTFKSAMSGVYLVYPLATPTETSFTTASLVTENGEVPLANENGVLVGKCNSDISADAGFIEGKIKLSDEDGDVYSNKIQIHVERSPQ